MLNRERLLPVDCKEMLLSIRSFVTSRLRNEKRFRYESRDANFVLSCNPAGATKVKSRVVFRNATAAAASASLFVAAAASFWHWALAS
jgi:hypothetical protein